MKYYRDNEGFIYKKSGEKAQTLYLDCFNEPQCTAGARFSKQTQEIKKIGTHTDEKPTEHVVMKIAFEANLKNEARKVENAGVSVLNLYKRAISVNEGIWLPTNHKPIFLTKLRRIRKYEKEKEKHGQRRPPAPATVDAATSPMTPSQCTRSKTKPTQHTLQTTSPTQPPHQNPSTSSSVGTSPMQSLAPEILANSLGSANEMQGSGSRRKTRNTVSSSTDIFFNFPNR